ncbi:MAG TPA: hypothetical protein PK268_01055 [Enterococcus sp.]|nr:hypothetical protein [Enterococcus sp.]HPR80496.1 hypothetical protein [Enterococcus sp.]
MTIQAALSLSKEKLTLQLADNQGQITIFYSNDKKLIAPEASVYLLFKEQKLRAIGATEGPFSSRTAYDTCVQITPPWEMEHGYLIQRLVETAEESKLKVTSKGAKKIPANYYSTVTTYQEVVLTLLEKFGLVFRKIEEKSQKPKPAKAQHRWRKEVSTIEFFVDEYDSQATVIWQKRNEMRIKKGAHLRQEIPLTKDGSIGLAGRFTKQLREEHADKINDFVTTEDVVLKSVNEVGHFLYYAGTNSWLVLKDKDGKTIDEWTVV